MTNQTTDGHSAEALKNATGYAWVDTETGGTDPRQNPIVQIALIVTDLDLKIKTFWSTLVKPLDTSLKIEDGALAINHLTREQIERDGVDEASAMTVFAALCNCYPGLIFAGYNAPFDVGFVNASLDRCGISQPYLIPWYDTLPLARKKLGRATPNHKLVTVAKHFGIDIENAHDALVDIHATIRVERALRRMG